MGTAMLSMWGVTPGRFSRFWGWLGREVARSLTIFFFWLLGRERCDADGSDDVFGMRWWLAALLVCIYDCHLSTGSAAGLPLRRHGSPVDFVLGSSQQGVGGIICASLDLARVLLR